MMRAGSVMWSVRRELRFAEGGAGARPMVFCAIARPEEFWTMLPEATCNLTDRVLFRDHHAYAMADMVGMVATAKKHGATGFFTTEKDAVKLDEAMLKRLNEVGPVCVVGLEAKFEDVTAVIRDLETRCR